MQRSSNKGGGCLIAAVVLIILIVVAALVVVAIAVWGGISIGDAMQVRDLKLDMKEAREEAFDEYLDNGTALQDSESGREYLRLRNELIERGEMKESEDASFLEMTGTTVDRAAVPSVDLENKPSQNDTLVLENNDQSTEDEEPDDKSFLGNLFGKDNDAQEESGSASTGSHAQPDNTPAQKPEKDKNADKGDTSKLTDEQLEEMKDIEAWLAEHYADTPYCTCDYYYKQLGSDGYNYIYVYGVHRTSEYLDETFYIKCKRTRIGSKWVVEGSAILGGNYDLPHTYDWNIEGTWVYQDDEHDYTLTIKDLKMDPDTANSQLPEFTMTLSCELEGEGKDAVTANNIPARLKMETNNISWNDFRGWDLSSELNAPDMPYYFIGLYPTGGDRSGSGFGFVLDGCWLTKR